MKYTITGVQLSRSLSLGYMGSEGCDVWVELRQLDASASSVSLGWQDGGYNAGFKSLPSVNWHIVLF